LTGPTSSAAGEPEFLNVPQKQLDLLRVLAVSLHQLPVPVQAHLRPWRWPQSSHQHHDFREVTALLEFLTNLNEAQDVSNRDRLPSFHRSRRWGNLLATAAPPRPF